MFIRTPYNYSMPDASLASGLSCPEPTLAQQQYKDETDINYIVKQYGVTGQLPVAIKAPVYGDFSTVVDYHTAQNAIRAAQESFMALPSEVRARFGNDPQALVEFCSDDANAAEMAELGLVDGPPPDLSGTPAPNPPTPL